MESRDWKTVYEAAFNSHDAQKYIALFHEDALYTNAAINETMSRDQLYDYYIKLFHAFPNIRVAINSFIINDDMFTHEWYVDQYYDINKNPCTLLGVGVGAFKSDLIIRYTDYYHFNFGDDKHKKLWTKSYNIDQFNEVLNSTDILKYQKSKLSDDKKTVIKAVLIELLVLEKIYLDPELTLSSLAIKLNVPNYQLSQVINTNFKKTFSELVNHYRVEESLLLLSDRKNDNLLISDIANRCGFGSPASFYKAFAKHTTITPTQYRQKLHM